MFGGLFQNVSDMKATFDPAVHKNLDVTTDKNKADLQRDAPSQNEKVIPIQSSASKNEKEEEEANEQMTEKPSIDLFKSIFASDEESDGDDEDGESEANKTSKTIPIDNSKEEQNKIEPKQSLSKPRGIFSGVNFSDLNQNFNPCLKSPTPNVQSAGAEPNGDDDECDDYYGPVLPPTPALQSYPATRSDAKDTLHCSNDKNSRGEKHQHKKKKRKDKRKKEKKKKSSKKSDHHSSRKRKRHHSSSSSSSSSSPERDTSAHHIEDKLLDLLKRVRHGH